MAKLVLTRAGAAIGKALLPNGISVFGAKISGAVLGRSLGSYVSGALFAPTREGPRIETLAIMESREGAGIPNIYGRMRVAGQVIWAARFKERSRDRRTAGKGSPKVRHYRYSVSFAVALGEGEATRIGLVWANGDPFDLAGVTWRFYPGSETQLPDPLIEAIEGPGNAPAYRGTAYIVFEDLPLEDFGNRLPQLSFEVFRAAPNATDASSIRSLVEAVNIIPASGEFAYDTEIVSARRFPGIETPQNVHSGRGDADFTVSMDQLQADLPNVRRAALTVGWFGDDLRAGHCKIRPGVELASKHTVPDNWHSAGLNRDAAYLISQDESGYAHYGGTPSDTSVIRALRDMVQRGIQPVVTPFLFMDVPPGNGRDDPYGAPEQAAFPWRGRITGSPDDISEFLGNVQPEDFSITGDRVIYSGAPEDWGYRRFILHLAHLAKIAGGVEAFLIGSEMVALSRVRSSDGAFPFVHGLSELAQEVKALLGPGVKVSYAADWTEYGAYADGSDVYFPLDSLWENEAIDFVGIDWYPPMADWRSGSDHLDALAGYEGLEDAAYLASNIDGGEAYDWYYATDSDRAAQFRTPIDDTAYGEHWVFRQKDILGWWTQTHHPRTGGVRADVPTGWIPQSKPIRLMEIGFPAADKGANAPNLFFDPKSAESALPPFSDGTYNDLQQRRALEVALSHWHAQPGIEAVYVWCWDARPFPAFPAREDVWSDGSNWRYGHWLNGRVTASELGAIVQDICTRGGVKAKTSGLRGMVEGYALSGVSSVRGALEPLRAAFGFNVIERGGALVFEMTEPASTLMFDPDDAAGDGLQFSRRLLDKRPGALRLIYISASDAYAPAVSEARDTRGDRGAIIDVALPIVMGQAQAADLSSTLLTRAVKSDTAELRVCLKHIGSEPGDNVSLADHAGLWSIQDIEDDGITRTFSLSEFSPSPSAYLGIQPHADPSVATLSSMPEFMIIDAVGTAPLIAAAGTPWPEDVRVLAGASAETLHERARIAETATMGMVQVGAEERPIGRWDRSSSLLIEFPDGEVSSVGALAVLSGANQMFIETVIGWELIAFQHAELVGPDTYQLTGLLRGLSGTQPGAISEGARCVLLDEALVSASLGSDEIGAALVWQLDTGARRGGLKESTYQAQGTLALRPAHLRAVRQGNTLNLRWTRRGPDVPESWALPEADNIGVFRIAIRGVTGLLATFEVTEPRASIVPPAHASHVHIAEIGPDGRSGAELVLSIPDALT